MAAVVLSEDLGRLAASLAGWDSARVAQDDVVWKPPGSGPVAFHQDSAYISRQFLPVRQDLAIGFGPLQVRSGGHTDRSRDSQRESRPTHRNSTLTTESSTIRSPTAA